MLTNIQTCLWLFILAYSTISPAASSDAKVSTGIGEQHHTHHIKLPVQNSMKKQFLSSANEPEDDIHQRDHQKTGNADNHIQETSNMERSIVLSAAASSDAKASPDIGEQPHTHHIKLTGQHSKKNQFLSSANEPENDIHQHNHQKSANFDNSLQKMPKVDENLENTSKIDENLESMPIVDENLENKLKVGGNLENTSKIDENHVKMLKVKQMHHKTKNIDENHQKLPKVDENLKNPSNIDEHFEKMSTVGEYFDKISKVGENLENTLKFDQKMSKIDENYEKMSRNERDVHHFYVNVSNVIWPVKRTANIDGDITLGN